MIKIKLLFVLTAMILTCTITAQVSINTDGTNPDASAMFEVKSTSKGMLTPRMSQAEIEAIASPAIGLIVFNTTDSRFYFYDDGAGEWKEIAIGTGTITPTPPWSCGDAFVDSRNSQSYTTVQIGTQCWMAENLNIGTMINSSSAPTNNGTIEKYCYDNSTSNCDTYGGMYQWNEMMEYITTQGTQGICPTSWHLPTDDEWKTMEMQLGMTQTQADATGYRGTDEGEKMKSTSGWNNNGNGTNSSGFNALPGGSRTSFGTTANFGSNGFWWTSSEDSDTYALSRGLLSSLDQVRRFNLGVAGDGISVRCLKD
ncbi:MAG: FISUMP domain-containing protein [Bacteroidota bacterium]